FRRASGHGHGCLHFKACSRSVHLQPPTCSHVCPEHEPTGANPSASGAASGGVSPSTGALAVR
ncbi:unnamed protein product, partial [Closterium sp. NIES-53]